MWEGSHKTNNISSQKKKKTSVAQNNIKKKKFCPRWRPRCRSHRRPRRRPHRRPRRRPSHRSRVLWYKIEAIILQLSVLLHPRESSTGVLMLLRTGLEMTLYPRQASFCIRGERRRGWPCTLRVYYQAETRLPHPAAAAPR